MDSIARETNRQADGRFGHQPHSEPTGVRLALEETDQQRANRAVNSAWHQEWSSLHTVRLTVESVADHLRDDTRDPAFEHGVQNLIYRLFEHTPRNDYPDLTAAAAAKRLLAEAGAGMAVSSPGRRLHAHIATTQPELLAPVVDAVRARKAAQHELGQFTATAPAHT